MDSGQAAADPALTALAAAVLRTTRSPERILEIGCGEGDGVLFLAREFPAARVRGVDPSEEEIRVARARVGLDPEGRVVFKAAAPSSLPYPDDFFDLVAHRGGRLRPAEIVRVMRPGAGLIVVPKHPPSTRRRLASTLLPARLSRRRGFGPIESGEAGGWPFYVTHLGGGR